MRVSRYLWLVMVLALGVQIPAGAALARPGAIVRLPSIRWLSMMTPTTGWALGASDILRTTDGGTRWENVSPPGAVLSQESMAVAIGTSAAWVTATRTGSQAPLLARTTDGGRSWRAYPIPLPVDAAGSRT